MVGASFARVKTLSENQWRVVTGLVALSNLLRGGRCGLALLADEHDEHLAGISPVLNS